jgi:hypothetical protein
VGNGHADGHNGNGGAIVEGKRPATPSSIQRRTNAAAA